VEEWFRGQLPRSVEYGLEYLCFSSSGVTISFAVLDPLWCPMQPNGAVSTHEDSHGLSCPVVYDVM
jgi:hypothetical protein